MSLWKTLRSSWLSHILHFLYISVRPRRGVGNQRKWHRIVKKKAIWCARGLAGNMIFAVCLFFFFFQHSLEEAERRGLMLQGALVALWKQGGGHVWNVCVTSRRAKQYWLSPAVQPLASYFLFIYFPLSSTRPWQQQAFSYRFVVPHSQEVSNDENTKVFFGGHVIIYSVFVFFVFFFMWVCLRCPGSVSKWSEGASLFLSPAVRSAFFGEPGLPVSAGWQQCFLTFWALILSFWRIFPFDVSVSCQRLLIICLMRDFGGCQNWLAERTSP